MSVSHNPYQSDSRQDPSSGHGSLREVDAWLELLCDGLTFDLLGLGGGPPPNSAEIAYKFGLTEATGTEGLEAVGLFPGPHLAEGANSIPVIRTMIAIATELVERFEGCALIQWTPARSAMSPDFFCKVAGEWLRGGPFPALGLIGYRETADGRLESEGLGILLDREVSVAAELAIDRIAATKLAMRIVHSLVGRQAPHSEVPFEFDGLNMRLRPDAERRLILVEPA